MVTPYIDIPSAAYFAEDAVIPERRREGISNSMKILLLDSATTMGFKTMVLRTSVNSFQQAAAVKKLGAEQIDGLFQDVESLRLDDRVTPDTRMFFTFDIGSPDMVWRR